MDKHGMPLTPGLNSEMSGGITLKLLVQGNSQYEFRLTDETDQPCHFSAFSDEKGLIFEGNVIGCAHPWREVLGTLNFRTPDIPPLKQSMDSVLSFRVRTKTCPLLRFSLASGLWLFVVPRADLKQKADTRPYTMSGVLNLQSVMAAQEPEKHCKRK
jgi:hypothetical protein